MSFKDLSKGVYENLEQDTLDDMLNKLCIRGISLGDFQLICLLMAAVIDEGGGHVQDITVLQMLFEMGGRPTELRTALLLNCIWKYTLILDQQFPDMPATLRIASRGWQRAFPFYETDKDIEKELDVQRRWELLNLDRFTSVSNTDVIKPSTSGDGGHGS